MNINNDTDISKILNQIKNLRLITDNESYTKTFDALTERVNSKVFRIAVVGEFSSGKSTFINAIISKDVLRLWVPRTNAAVTAVTQKRILCFELL